MAGLTLYHSYIGNQLDGTAVVDWDDDTIKAALLTSSYTPDAANHEFWNDVNSNEVSGTGYTSGGSTVANLDVTVSAGGVATIDGDDITWSQEDGSPEGFDDARYLVVYKDSGSPSTSPLVGYLDLTTDRTNVTGDFIIQWDDLGILRYGVGTIS